MSNTLPMSGEFFIKRLSDLCLRSGLSGFPANENAQHILLKSVVLTIEGAGTFTEKEIDEKMKYWIESISRFKEIDHVMLRRLLVDAGYVTRNRDGSCYRVSPIDPRPELFDDSVEQIDVAASVQTAREEIDRRKKEYAKKASK